jgi:hypothetical protein
MNQSYLTNAKTPNVTQILDACMPNHQPTVLTPLRSSVC